MILYRDKINIKVVIPDEVYNFLPNNCAWYSDDSSAGETVWANWARGYVAIVGLRPTDG